MSKKRTIDAFFVPDAKKSRTKENNEEPVGKSNHPTYPFPIPELPASISKELPSLPARPARNVNDQPDLDLVYFEPYFPSYIAKELYEFLRSELPFYRVEYDIKRGGISTHIRTPRYTTVFGIDQTSRFEEQAQGGSASASGEVALVDANTGARILPDTAYAGCAVAPRPLPKCLDDLRVSVEAATGCRFNFCLVNYYASGADSISFHSDDERFLGPEPAIASLSLGARRDFVMKHKPVTAVAAAAVVPMLGGGEKKQQQKPQLGREAKQVKLPLASGDMVLMRGRTQANWLHSVPKRSGKNEDDGGRINITFRKALVRGGTLNYYKYNVGTGPVYKWDGLRKEMALWRTGSST